MNIEDLTVKQARELAALFGGQQAPAAAHPAQQFIGLYVIIRSDMAGCFAGTLVSATPTGNNRYAAMISGSRQLFRWWCAEGTGLAGVAEHGLKKDKPELRTGALRTTLQAVDDVFQTDVCTDVGRESILSQPTVQS